MALNLSMVFVCLTIGACVARLLQNKSSFQISILLSLGLVSLTQLFLFSSVETQNLSTEGGLINLILLFLATIIVIMGSVISYRKQRLHEGEEKEEHIGLKH